MKAIYFCVLILLGFNAASTWPEYIDLDYLLNHWDEIDTYDELLGRCTTNNPVICRNCTTQGTCVLMSDVYKIYNTTCEDGFVCSEVAATPGCTNATTATVCICTPADEGGKIKDPYDNTTFYWCNNGIAYPDSCAPGFIFDEITSECVKDPAGGGGGGGGGGAVCSPGNATCSDQGFFPHPTECQYYIACFPDANSVLQPECKDCNVSMIYDGTGCINAPTPITCSATGLSDNPNECRSYYLCPSPTATPDFYCCDEGFYFDAVTTNDCQNNSAGVCADRSDCEIKEAGGPYCLPSSVTTTPVAATTPSEVTTASTTASEVTTASTTTSEVTTASATTSEVTTSSATTSEVTTASATTSEVTTASATTSTTTSSVTTPTTTTAVTASTTTMTTTAASPTTSWTTYTCSTVGNTYENSEDCTLYYKCQKNELGQNYLVLYDCPAGQCYSSSYKRCV